MGISHYWYLEARIYYVRLDGVVTLADVKASDELALTLLDRYYAHTPLAIVHGLVDFTALDDLRVSLSSVMQFISGSPARQGLIKYFGNGYSIDIGFQPHHKVNKFMSAVLHQRDNVRYRQVNTIADAVRFLNDMDTTLPALPVLTFEQMPLLARVGENISAQG